MQNMTNDTKLYANIHNLFLSCYLYAVCSYFSVQDEREQAIQAEREQRREERRQQREKERQQREKERYARQKKREEFFKKYSINKRVKM